MIFKYVLTILALVNLSFALHIKRDDINSTTDSDAATTTIPDVDDLLSSLMVTPTATDDLGDIFTGTLTVPFPTDIASGLPTDIPTAIPTALPTSIGDIGNLTECLADAATYANATSQCSDDLNVGAMNLTSSEISSPSDEQIKSWISANQACFCEGDALSSGESMYQCYAQMNLTLPSTNQTWLNSTYGNSTNDNTTDYPPAFYLINGTDAMTNINQSYAGICKNKALSFAVFSSGWAAGVFTSETYVSVRKYMISNGMLHEGQSSSAISNGVGMSFGLIIASVLGFIALF